MKKIVALGGGTGLSTLLRGLKLYPVKLTAVVTVTDEGGSSGRLRRELNVIPPGDIRNCLVALSCEESLMSRLLQYRFTKSGSLYNHSFGNLFLVAISDLAGGFEKGIIETSKVLAIKGQVMPVTLAGVRLKAELSDGRTICGEKKISSIRHGESGKKVCLKRIYLSGRNIKPNPKVLSAISAANLIVLGPGSLYTSVISNLLVPGIPAAIKRTKAKKIYISNIMTQPGETDGYGLSAHMKVIKKYSGIEFDYVLINKGKIPKGLLSKYMLKNAAPVGDDLAWSENGKKIYGNFVSADYYARHSSERLAAALIKILNKETVEKP